MFYYKSSRRKLGLRLLLFVLSAVCERLGKFYAWARRTKVRNHGAFTLSKPLDRSTRVRLTGCAEIRTTYFVLTVGFASAVLT